MAMQAYFGNLNAHACLRYGFLQAQERYKARADRNPLAGMVFRQVLHTFTLLHTNKGAVHLAS